MRPDSCTLITRRPNQKWSQPPTNLTFGLMSSDVSSRSLTTNFSLLGRCSLRWIRRTLVGMSLQCHQNATMGQSEDHA